MYSFQFILQVLVHALAKFQAAVRVDLRKGVGRHEGCALVKTLDTLNSIIYLNIFFLCHLGTSEFLSPFFEFSKREGLVAGGWGIIVLFTGQSYEGIFKIVRCSGVLLVGKNKDPRELRG